MVDERYLALKPRRLSFVEAAAAPLVTITAWEALRERARIGTGQFALVQAGAGGVGHMSVQIARLAGARVATTVRPGPKARLASSLGAELRDVSAAGRGRRTPRAGSRPDHGQGSPDHAVSGDAPAWPSPAHKGLMADVPHKGLMADV